jgi:hypothetical protein
VDDLVGVAYVGSEAEAVMIQGLLEENGIRSMQQTVWPSGPLLGYGPLNFEGGRRGVMVDPERAEEARTLLADVVTESESEPPEPVNAAYLEDARGGHKPRSYGLIGGFARIYLVAFGIFAVAFAVFMLLRAF